MKQPRLLGTVGPGLVFPVGWYGWRELHRMIVHLSRSPLRRHGGVTACGMDLTSYVFESVPPGGRAGMSLCDACVQQVEPEPPRAA